MYSPALDEEDPGGFVYVRPFVQSIVIVPEVWVLIATRT